jgi:hypothetical protein
MAGEYGPDPSGPLFGDDSGHEQSASGLAHSKTWRLVDSSRKACTPENRECVGTMNCNAVVHASSLWGCRLQECSRKGSLRVAAGAVIVLSSLAASLNGCVTKSQADAQVRMAYLAGRQSALIEMQQQQARGPTVTVLGLVQNPLVKWTEGLTLGQAIVNAVYTAPTDPKNIVIRRSGQQIQFDPKRLLRGEDFPLESGDIIQLEQ